MADNSNDGNVGMQPTIATQGGFSAAGSSPQGAYPAQPGQEAQSYPNQPQQEGGGSSPNLPGGGGAPPGPAGGAGGRPPKRDLFDLLNGFPANVAIIFGLFMVLLGAMLPDCRSAGARSSVAEWEQARAMMELELESFRETQADQRRAEEAARAANPMAPPDPNADTRRVEALRAHQRQLRSRHRIEELQRDAIAAQTTVAGMNGHLVVKWLGYVMLLVGLLAMTMASTGLKQKVSLVITVVVLFSALNGARIDLSADASVGEERQRAAPTTTSRDRSRDRTP